MFRMQRVPYALIRLDAVRGGILGMMLISPYHAALHWLSADAPEPLPIDHFGAQIFAELEVLAATPVGQPVTQVLAKETALLAEEFGHRSRPVALCVEDITLASPSFAASRLDARLLDWIAAERSGTPLCPFRCSNCDERLQRLGTGTVRNPATDVRPLNYSCREHPTQEARYDPAVGRWTDLRN